MASQTGWIGVDLDGTLAHYDGWKDGAIGDPVAPMVAHVKQLLVAGWHVKIMTARVAPASLRINDIDWWDAALPIMEWCREHLGQILPVTCEKDFSMVALYDDRVIAVEPNTGKILSGSPPA